MHQEKFGSRIIGREKLQQLQKHSRIVYIINLLTKQKETWRMSLWMSEEGWREGIVRELGMDMYILLYLKWIANQDLRDFV